MAPASAEAADAASVASPASAAEAQAPGSDLPCAMGAVLHKEMLMLQGADELVALAEELAKQQRAWVADKERLLASCTAAQSTAWRQAAEQHALLAPLPSLLQQAQGARLMELRDAVHEACWVDRVQRNAAWRHQEELDEALRWRQRIERCRLSRQRAQLKEEQERLEREARERLRQDRARLERERAMADKRRAALAREHEQLVAQLELERELRLPHRKLASVQTDALPSALPADPAKALPSEQDYSEESFESPGESYDEDFDDEDVGTDSEEDEKDSSKSSEVLSSGSSDKSSLDVRPTPKPKPKPAPARPVPRPKAARTSEHSESIAESLSGSSILSQLPSSGQDRSSSDALAPSRPSQPRAAASAKSLASHSSHDGSSSVAESVASASRSSQGRHSSGKSHGSRRGSRSGSGSGGISESILSMSG